MTDNNNINKTVYISNLPFSLTNNDVHKIFEKFGTILKITILKDKYRRSRGVSFINFENSENAENCVGEINNKEMFGRTLKASIANNNNRSSEFSNKTKKYYDKIKCFECGEEGHLSYICPKNILGERLPPKKDKKRKHTQESENIRNSEDDEGTTIEIQNQSKILKPKKYKKSTYFSDDDEIDSGEEQVFFN